MAKKRVKIPSRQGGRPKKNNQQKEIMRQISQMREQLMEAQDKLAEKEFTASAGGGAVSATVKGTYELVSISIDPGVVDEDDIEMLEDMVVAAVNNACEQARQFSEEQTAALTGGNLPDLGIPEF